ncbi:hypothetical protein AVEN_101456-1 [Araneus ventricosus]|uniref:Uncharacterized protein n=1 Tax=Araneus ventricosus TaxID=182803 RepID=A0A4Y2CVB7_ARAVE|nr:hypothetical protein AVEN_101456-1 [Araneus ventricosus]
MDLNHYYTESITFCTAMAVLVQNGKTWTFINLTLKTPFGFSVIVRVPLIQWMLWGRVLASLESIERCGVVTTTPMTGRTSYGRSGAVAGDRR